MQQTDWATLATTAAAGFDPVPDGTYDAVVVECKLTSTKDKGNPMYAVKFNVMEGPYKDRKIWNNFTATQGNPNAMGFFFKHMEALGLPKSWFMTNPADQAIAEALLNRQCTLVVGHREYNNVVRNQVNDVRPLGAAVPGASSPISFPPPAQAAPAPVPAPAPAPAPVFAAPPVAVAPVPAPAPAPVAEAPAPAPAFATPPVPAPAPAAAPAPLPPPPAPAAPGTPPPPPAF